MRHRRRRKAAMAGMLLPTQLCKIQMLLLSLLEQWGDLSLEKAVLNMEGKCPGIGKPKGSWI